MSSTVHRKPIANFFILKDLQMRLIMRIVLAGFVSTLVCSGTLLLTYLVKYKSVHFWLVNLGQNPDISDPKNIVFIILPSLAISTIVNIAVAIAIGFYASRKYAVPIYKLEQWAMLLRMGKLNARLTFREKEEMQELTNRCNLLADDLRTRFLEIKKQAESLRNSGVQNDQVSTIEKIVSQLELESQAIDVHTNFYALPSDHQGIPHPKKP
jgi:methyl-accepting chemotaxis protein